MVSDAEIVETAGCPARGRPALRRTRTPLLSTPPRLRVDVLGGLQVNGNEQPLALPASKKTRALLAYLALTGRRHHREHLCDLLWDIPDDPRGALRWSLSRLRAVIEPVCPGALQADREYVWIETGQLSVDLFLHQALLDRRDAPVGDAAQLAAAVEALRQPLLVGLDQSGQSQFQAWLIALRDEAEGVHRRLLERLALDSDSPPAEALPWCREWLECDPLNARAASALARTLTRMGRRDEAVEVADRFQKGARAAGIEPGDVAALDDPASGPETAPRNLSTPDLLQRQAISFRTTADGVRIAMATVGRGAPLVKAANWLNHLELDWYSPIWAPMFRELAQDYQFVRYDERGNGLSDWNVSDLTFEAFVQDLKTVVEATTEGPVPILGISQGCAVAIEYAARHPERVSHLILWGGYAEGWRINATPEVQAEREAIFTLVRQGWGRPDPIYRQLFSTSFMPSATAEELEWFNNFQRETVSAENAVRFLEVFADIDVRHRLAEVRAPTLVMHARGDQRIPMSVGIDIAAGIPGAEFVALDTDNHLLLGREPASDAFVAHVRQFLDEH